METEFYLNRFLCQSIIAVKLATAKPQVLPPCQKNLKISAYAVASVTQRSNKTVPVNVAIDTPRDLVMI